MYKKWNNRLNIIKKNVYLNENAIIYDKVQQKIVWVLEQQQKNETKFSELCSIRV